MAVLTESWLVDILLLVATVLYILYLYSSRKYNYFKERGIPFLQPIPFVGQLDVFTKSQYDLGKVLYSKFEDERFFGYFQASVPTLLVKDPALVQRIMVKDFAHFHDRGFPVAEHDLLQNNLFNLKGHPWRVMRQKLIPTFSTGKLKQMFDQLNESVANLMRELDEVAQNGEAVDIKQYFSSLSSEIIAGTAFGLDINKNSPQGVEFYKQVKDVFKQGKKQKLLLFFMLMVPKLFNSLGLKIFTEDQINYFVNLTKATKDYRKKNNVKRNDYFQLLLSLQEAEESGKNFVQDNEKDTLINQMEYVPVSSDKELKIFTDEDITAQSFVFLTAGSDTISGTLGFILYHVAKDPAIQTKLREEVTKSLTMHGGWTYQAVKEMTFMDQVIQETQRMYPVVPITLRECTIPYTIPNSNIVLEKGTVIAIPVLGLQMDPKYYPNPDVFDPERFADNNHKPSSIFMPFGDGPRICIAMRFAIVEMKICLARIISQFSVYVSSKTVEPFTIDTNSFFPWPVGGIWIELQKLSA